MGKELTRRFALMTGAATIAAGWGLPAVAFPRSRPPTSRARLSQLLVTIPLNYPPCPPPPGPPFNCQCALRPPELPIGRATYYPNDDVLDGLGQPCSAIRIIPDLDVEIHQLAFYDKWSSWTMTFVQDGKPHDMSTADPDIDSHRWTWKPTLANTQGLMTLQFPGSTHQSVTLRSVAGSINLIRADSLVGDIDIAQLT